MFKLHFLGKPGACRACWLSQKSGLDQVRRAALCHRQGALCAPGCNTGFDFPLALTTNACEFISACYGMPNQHCAQGHNHWRDQAAPHCFSYELSAFDDAEFGACGKQTLVDGVLCYTELTGGLLTGHPACDSHNALKLALC